MKEQKSIIGAGFESGTNFAKASVKATAMGCAFAVGFISSPVTVAVSLGKQRAAKKKVEIDNTPAATKAAADLAFARAESGIRKPELEPTPTPAPPVQEIKTKPAPAESAPATGAVELSGDAIPAV